MCRPAECWPLLRSLINGPPIQLVHTMLHSTHSFAHSLIAVCMVCTTIISCLHVSLLFVVLHWSCTDNKNAIKSKYMISAAKVNLEKAANDGRRTQYIAQRTPYYFILCAHLNANNKKDERKKNKWCEAMRMISHNWSQIKWKRRRRRNWIDSAWKWNGKCRLRCIYVWCIVYDHTLHSIHQQHSEVAGKSVWISRRPMYLFNLEYLMT